MTLGDTLRTGLSAIGGHRLRSALTVLGILIGIAAVILTVGLGQGAQDEVNGAIASLGTNLLIVTPGSVTSGGVQGGLGSASTLTIGDAQALGSHLDAPDIAAVAPQVQKTMSMTAGISNWTAPVVGTTPSWLGVRSRTVAAGRFLTQADVTSEAHVVVLGELVAANLFSSPASAIGAKVDLNGVPFQVVGVLAAAGSSANTNQDNLVTVPISTAQSQLFGGPDRRSVQAILLEATSPATMSAAYQEADSLLLQLHGITRPALADFTITPQTSLLSTASSISRTLTVLLAGVAAISLIVGGIGVMNILLVSVTERIREIGLRKALGATPGAIRSQFLVEAIILGVVGGVGGVLLGVIGAIGLPHLIGHPVTLSPVAVVAAVFVAALVALAAGVYPATRAARLVPMEALRSE
ncbi:MAG: ABC transporter permease [Acidimicrobiales bacterium]